MFVTPDAASAHLNHYECCHLVVKASSYSTCVNSYQGDWQAVRFGVEADSAPPLSEQIRQELEIASDRGS